MGVSEAELVGEILRLNREARANRTRPVSWRTVTEMGTGTGSGQWRLLLLWAKAVATVSRLCSSETDADADADLDPCRSFADGRLFSALLSYYQPNLLPTAVLHRFESNYVDTWSAFLSAVNFPHSRTNAAISLRSLLNCSAQLVIRLGGRIGRSSSADAAVVAERMLPIGTGWESGAAQSESALPETDRSREGNERRQENTD